MKNWISILDKKPTVNQEVVIFLCNSSILPAKCTVDNGNIIFTTKNNIYSTDDISWWMPEDKSEENPKQKCRKCGIR